MLSPLSMSVNLPLGSQPPERLPPIHKAQSLIPSPGEGGNGPEHSSVCLSFQFLRMSFPGQVEIKGDPVSVNKNIQVSQTHCNHACTVFRKASQMGARRDHDVPGVSPRGLSLCVMAQVWRPCGSWFIPPTMRLNSSRQTQWQEY